MRSIRSPSIWEWHELYLIDANVFINAKNTYYPFSLVPGFWSWVEQQAREGRLYSIVQLKAELNKGDDQLKNWIRLLPPGFWLKDTPASAAALGELTIWANSGRYTPTAIQTFYQSADYRLAAQAKATGYTVVTNEAAAPRRTREIKLPDACVGISAQAVNPFVWMQREATRFEGFGHS